jgi:predicted DsbA family dithiol-disulfide isomerase
MALMSAYGVSAGIKFKFGGTVANTMNAHRVIQHFQEEKGSEVADKIINCEWNRARRFCFSRPRMQPLCQLLTYQLLYSALYSQYFENEQHPSADATLLKATTDAGIPESEAKPFIEDQNDGMLDVKNMVRQQAGNGVDAVPNIMFEGKRRDITLVGAKEVEEYTKTLKQIVKESK